MKRKMNFQSWICALASLALLAGPAVAIADDVVQENDVEVEVDLEKVKQEEKENAQRQDQQEQNQQQRNKDKSQRQDQKQDQKKVVRKLESLLGAPLRNAMNKQIGELTNVAIAQDGTLRYGIIGAGGILGIGEDHIAVPWEKLQVNWEKGAVSLDTTAEDLTMAPRLKDKGFKELENENWLLQFAKYFKLEADVDPTQGEFKADVNLSPAGKNEGYESLPKSLLAAQLIGAEVVGKNDKEIAEADNLIVGDNHQIKFIVLGSGGVLDLGETHFAVPWEKAEVKQAENELRFHLPITIEQLKEAPDLDSEMVKLTDEKFVADLENFYVKIEADEE